MTDIYTIEPQREIAGRESGWVLCSVKTAETFTVCKNPSDTDQGAVNSFDTLEAARAAYPTATITMLEYHIVKGEVQNLDGHDTSGVKLGDVEWQFSDGPPGKRGSSADYLSLEEGLAELSPAIFHWVGAPLKFTFKEVTEEAYNYGMNVLPPAVQGVGGFLVGEPWDHAVCPVTGKFSARYQGFFERNNKHYAAVEPMSRAAFHTIKVHDVGVACDRCGILKTSGHMCGSCGENV